MINSRERTHKILRYWLTLEALTPQTADKAYPDDKIEPSYEINKEKGAMPWMEGHEHRRKQPRDQHQRHYTFSLSRSSPFRSGLWPPSERFLTLKETGGPPTLRFSLWPIDP